MPTENIELAKKAIDLIRENHKEAIDINELANELENLPSNNSNADTSENLLKVAVVGAFSCGKSSFINSVLDKEIEPTGSIPINHAITVLSYGKKLEICADAGVRFSLEEYKKEVQKSNPGYRYFYIKSPCEELKNIKLYDTPGFGSVNKDHSESDKADIELSEEAANEADVIFYLVDITNGTLQTSDQKYLSKLSRGNNNFFLVLNRADEKSPKARETIKKEIIKQSGLNSEQVMLYSSLPDNELNEVIFGNYKEAVRKEFSMLNKKKRPVKQNFDLTSNQLQNLQKICVKYAKLEKDEIEKNFSDANRYGYANEFANEFYRLNKDLITRNASMLFDIKEYKEYPKYDYKMKILNILNMAKYNKDYKIFYQVIILNPNIYDAIYYYNLAGNYVKDFYNIILKHIFEFCRDQKKLKNELMWDFSATRSYSNYKEAESVKTWFVELMQKKYSICSSDIKEIICKDYENYMGCNASNEAKTDSAKRAYNERWKKIRNLVARIHIGNSKQNVDHYAVSNNKEDMSEELVEGVINGVYSKQARVDEIDRLLPFADSSEKFTLKLERTRLVHEITKEKWITH